MDREEFSQVWQQTLGQTLEIEQQNAQFSNGMSTTTSQKYEEAAAMSDDEIWTKIQAGEL